VQVPRWRSERSNQDAFVIPSAARDRNKMAILVNRTCILLRSLAALGMTNSFDTLSTLGMTSVAKLRAGVERGIRVLYPARSARSDVIRVRIAEISHWRVLYAAKRELKPK
jgi:hypothetical protein